MADIDNKYPSWFLFFWERGPLIPIVGAVVLVGGVIGVAVQLENRLAHIEDRLTNQPPKTYTPPDLKSLAADVDENLLFVRQKVYVPVYSHVYHRGGSPYLLETTLSIRNVDPARPVYVESVEYFDTNGELVKTQVDQLLELKPLQTIEFLVEMKNSTGGSGANFLVEWRSAANVNRPLIEAVMVGTKGAQGISLSRQGVDLDMNRGR